MSYKSGSIFGFDYSTTNSAPYDDTYWGRQNTATDVKTYEDWIQRAARQAAQQVGYLDQRLWLESPTQNQQPEEASGPLEFDGPPVPATAAPSQEYRDRLKKIGATALLAKLMAEEDIQAFQQHVSEHGLRFYNRKNVEAYLIKQGKAAAVAAGKNEKDYGVLWRIAIAWTPLASYTQPIPAPVLETIERVHDAFPAAQFGISEVKEYPDPFLMVSLHGETFIIERWDEPAYRESE